MIKNMTMRKVSIALILIFICFLFVIFPKEDPTLKLDDNVWSVSGDAVEKLFKMTKFNSDDAIKRFIKKLKNMGVDNELKLLGAKTGDTVKVLDYEFEYIE